MSNAGRPEETEEVAKMVGEERRNGGWVSVRSFQEDPAGVDPGVSALKDEVCKRL